MKLFSQDEEKLSLLKVHEWLAIAIVIGVIVGLACLTSLCERRDLSKVSLEFSVKKPSGFDVIIKGAVTYPGTYHLQTATKMQDLLNLAGVFPNADLRRFNLEAIVKKGRVINVPFRVMINIHLRGAVEVEHAISIPKGLKVEDLIHLVDLSADADVKFLKKKRRLKDEEVIVIPKLKK